MAFRAMVAILCACGCNPYDAGAFPCTTDVQCGAQGKCNSGFCSTPDTSCDSGFRYTEVSGTVSNQCVGETIEPCVNGDMPDPYESGIDCGTWGGTTENLGATVTRIGGLLVLRPPTATGGFTYASCTSFAEVDFSRGVFVEVDGVTDAAASSAFTEFQIFHSSNFGAEFQVDDGNLLARLGTGTDMLNVATFNPILHRFWRIRGEANVLIWETSSDAQRWNRFADVAVAIPPSVKVNLGAGTAVPEAAPGEARFEGFNVCP